MEEGVFDEVPQFVEFLVVYTLVFAVFPRWNDRVHILIKSQPDYGVTIVALIRQQVFCCDAVDQAVSLSAICCRTLCNNGPDRHTMRIHGEMQLCVEPPFVRLIS